jgi:hypothetical protein
MKHSSLISLASTTTHDLKERKRTARKAAVEVAGHVIAKKTFR